MYASRTAWLERDRRSHWPTTRAGRVTAAAAAATTANEIGMATISSTSVRPARARRGSAGDDITPRIVEVEARHGVRAQAHRLPGRAAVEGAVEVAVGAVAAEEDHRRSVELVVV